MNRLDTLIVLVLFFSAMGSAWCAMMYQQPMAAYFGLGLLVCCGDWHEASEEVHQLKQTKSMTHYTWRKK